MVCRGDKVPMAMVHVSFGIPFKSQHVSTLLLLKISFYPRADAPLHRRSDGGLPPNGSHLQVHSLSVVSSIKLAFD
jgi:hypothetical protein